MVDVWFLFCIFSTFCIIIFHLIIDLNVPGLDNLFHSSKTTIHVAPYDSNLSLDKKDFSHLDLKRAKQLQNYGQKIVGLLFSIFNIAYWMIVYIY